MAVGQAEVEGHLCRSSCRVGWSSLDPAQVVEEAVGSEAQEDLEDPEGQEGCRAAHLSGPPRTGAEGVISGGAMMRCRTEHVSHDKERARTTRRTSTNEVL